MIVPSGQSPPEVGMALDVLLGKPFQEWNDVNLRWNSTEYGGVKDLRIPPHRIWKPDVLMYNSVGQVPMTDSRCLLVYTLVSRSFHQLCSGGDFFQLFPTTTSADEGFDGTYPTNVVVRNNGSCLYVPPGIFKSTCKIDITWFPFDDQRCEMKFGSWTYDGFQLDLQLQDDNGGDISSFITNGEWDLLEQATQKESGPRKHLPHALNVVKEPRSFKVTRIDRGGFTLLDVQ
ncbi:hypothetical protein C0J52_22086 [Blattella germanica]|nr:hypothetical protein C0J52_22086 [Blattella germanica]